MDKPARRCSDFGKVKLPLQPWGWERGGREARRVGESVERPVPGAGVKGTGLELLEWAAVGCPGVSPCSPLHSSFKKPPPGFLGWAGRVFYIYIYIHIYISSFKLLIVCLDHQNHPAALPTAAKPPRPMARLLFEQLCSPVQHCPGPGTNPRHRGSVCSPFPPLAAPSYHPLGEGNQSISQRGQEGSASNTPLPAHAPRDAAGTRKTVERFVLFFSDLPDPRKSGKKKDKNPPQKTKKKNQKTHLIHRK